jgi:PAS domain S-box-containing protein
VTPQTIPKAQATGKDPALRQAVLISVLVSLAYYLTAKIGFEFVLQPGSVSTLWMPNSLLLAGLLLTTKRFWWIVIAAAAPAHFASELLSGVPTTMVMSWFVSNSFQALFGAFCIRLFVKGQLRFDQVRDLTVFVLLGAFLAPFLSSFLDVALVILNRWGNTSYWETWRIRFLSNALASLTLIPVVMVWANGGLTALRKAPWRCYLEASLLAEALLLVGFYVFYSPNNVAEKTPSLLYWPLPLLLWAAVRFGVRGASTCLLLVMFLATTGAVRGSGPFLTGSSANNAVSIQWFLVVVSIPLMILTAIIEERRRAESSARQNEERLTLALNAASMGTWDWQVGDDKLVCSENAKRVLDVYGEDSTIDSLLKLVHPEDKASVENAVSNALYAGMPFEQEFRLLQNGHTRWILGIGSVLYDDNGSPTRMLGIGLDLTERKRAEQALAETNERNRAMLTAIPDMMFLMSSEGKFLDYYARDSKVLLLSPEEFLGRSVSEVMPPALADNIMEGLAQLNGSDQPHVFEYTLPINGEEHYYEARLVAVGTDKALSIIRDVTDARLAVQAARVSEEKLIQGHRQIRALAARLLTAQESERRRISLLLHDDVSQNIAAIGLSISRLKRKLPNTNEETVAELERLGVHVHDLNTQIRHLSHSLHPAVLEHLGLVAALESHVTEFGHEEKIAMKFVANVGSDPIPLDLSVCLYRVALEALRNVSRHSGASNASLSLTRDNGLLMLEVSDSGKGFDVEKARRGSGIGLLSTEERIKHFQGSLVIRSEPHVGTTLTARVPLPG